MDTARYFSGDDLWILRAKKRDLFLIEFPHISRPRRSCGLVYSPVWSISPSLILPLQVC